MSINLNPGNITELFKGFYEKGSNGGSRPQENGNAVPGQQPAAKHTRSFKGYLKKNGNKILFETLGGGEFIVDVSEELLKGYKGTVVTVSGKQNGDTIENAKVSLASAAPQKTSKGIRLPEEIVKAGNAAQAFLDRYKERVPGLLYARPGYKYINGVITKTPAITALVEKKVTKAVLPDSQKLPESFEGFDVEVVTASPADLLKYKFPKQESAELRELLEPGLLDFAGGQEAGILEAGEVTNNYIPPTNVQLEEVTAAMTLTCHVSPEQGWTNLRSFLDDTNDHLQIAIYDFSAPQLFETLKTVARRGTSIKMVYDGNPAAGLGEGSKEDDVKEETIINSLKRIAGNNFQYIQAWKGKSGICYNAYHTKVAVKDQKSFWLSSGNWQTSNQPNVDFSQDIGDTVNYNREWNVIVDNNALSSIFFKFIDWDFERSGEKPELELLEVAELPELYVLEDEVLEAGQRLTLFPSRKFVFTRNNPLRVQPVMSPDNYIEHAKKVIRSATRKLYFQNQYIKISKTVTDEYQELLQLLADKTNDDTIDCRIIIRKPFSTADKMEMMNALQAFGFNMSKIRIMKNTHTKGIIADSKVVMVGSHNWSNAGVQFNRDASLVIFNEDVAGYYEDVFLHDWDRRTINERSETETILLSEMQETGLPDMNVKPINWKEYFE